MLMSMMAAPTPSAMRAPSAIQCGFAAGDLNDVEAFALPFDAQPGIALALGQRRACRHLGHDQAGAEPRDLPPERGVRDPRHRRQEHRVRQQCGPHQEWLGRNVP